MKPSTIRIICAIGSISAAFGCTPPAARAPESQQSTVSVPSLTAISQGTETQERGGLVLQLVSSSFEVKDSPKATCTKQEAFLVQNNQYPYEIKTEPQFTVFPAVVEFKLKVTNHTTQVLKLAGTAFKFVAGDKELHLDDSQLAAFSDTILRPNDTKEFTLKGPSWAGLPKETPMGFSIFSIPTETDEAGNVKKKENFDWTFNYKLTDVQKNAAITYESVKMTSAEAQSRCENI